MYKEGSEGMTLTVIMQPRLGVGELIEDYAEGKINYRELNVAIASLGYATTSVFEMVRHIKPKQNTHDATP
jgi:hypothetical protein